MAGNRSSAGPLKTHMPQLVKTDICKFFMYSICQNGDACLYAHDKDEVRQKPDLSRTSMCKTMMEVGCCDDPTCRFAHKRAELRFTHGSFKMKMCGFVQSGHCKHGESCRFAHSQEELRIAKPVPDGIEDETLIAREELQGMQWHVPPPQSQGPIVREREREVASIPGKTMARTSGGGGGCDSCAASQEIRMQKLVFGKQSSTDVPSPPEPLYERRKVTKNEQQHRQRGQANQPLSSGRATKLNGANSSRWSTIDIDAGSGASGTQIEMNSADASSWASGSSTTELPRSEHTCPHSATSDSGSTNNVHSTGATSSAGGTAVSNIPGTQRSARKTQKPPKEAMVTTVLMVNVPTYLTQGAMLSMLEDLTQSMRGNYDFYYCPWDEEEGHNMGYALLNFPDPKHALDFQRHWTNRLVCRGSNERPLRVVRASVQGLEANLDYFSKVEISACSDLRFRPLYRDANSILQPLPLHVSPSSWESLVEPPSMLMADSGMEVVEQESFQGGSGSGEFSFGQPLQASVQDSRLSRSALQSDANMRRPVGSKKARHLQGRPKKHGHHRSAMPQQFPKSAAAPCNSSELPQRYPCSTDTELRNIAMQSAACLAEGFSAGAGGKIIATIDSKTASEAGSCAQQARSWPMMGAMMVPVPWPLGPLAETQGQGAATSTQNGPCHDFGQDQYFVEGGNCALAITGTQSCQTQQAALCHQHTAPYMMTLMQPMIPVGGNSSRTQQTLMPPTESMLQMMHNAWVNSDGGVYED
mmetsp:Transcript_95384/g.183995  ORF Transcript_95384/g.183995 Transcript_95384/m.183995 type:complete len:757 (-) Transcript_95384:326-2596(-)